MNILKKILLGTTLLAASAHTMAQNGSNSSYSRFGLGSLADQSQTFNRGMGGVSYGLRDGARINMQNPASYSGIDSLSFLFDVGLSLQAGHMSAPGATANTRNTSLTNVNTGFRLAKGLGMSLGFVPFSSIGYSFSKTSTTGDSYIGTQPVTTSTTYSGSGGLHQLYLGVGWNPFAKLSIGVNASYLWGDQAHYVTQSFYEGTTQSGNYSNQNLSYSADLKTYKLDFGLQYPIRISRQDWVTLGVTYGLGHSISGDATMLRYTSTGDSTEVVTHNAFDLPHTFGGGLSWRHQDKLLIAADASYEKWAECSAPIMDETDGIPSYSSQSGSYTDRTRFALGAEFIPAGSAKGKQYWETIRFRAGVNYSTPYIKVNGQNGPSEMGVSIGAGFPLSTKRLSGRSVINFSAEWKQRRPSVSSMVKENYFMINLGVTFNESWFVQWKID